MKRNALPHACARAGRGIARVLVLWAGISGAVSAAAPAPAAEPAVTSYLDAGRSLLAAGDTAGGLPILAAAAVTGPNVPVAQVSLLGLINQACFELDLSGLETARTLLPEDPALLECLGRRYEGKGLYLEAEATFQHWAEAHPELAEPLARLGELYVTAGWRSQALEAFARYLERNPGSTYAVRRMAAVAAAEVEALRPKAVAVADTDPAPIPHRLAAGPNAEAQFGLAVRYEHGLGVPVDRTLAAEAYARAARAGHGIAQYRFALLLQGGQGVERDPEAAAHWLTRAARNGLPEAQLHLALACLTGNGTPLDFAGAARWSGQAAAQGVPEAQFLLGTLYRYGIGVTRDSDAANAWLMKAAEAFLEAGRWPAGRHALVASFAADQGGPADAVPLGTPVDPQRVKNREVTP
jgi:TPR repeat protein